MKFSHGELVQMQVAGENRCVCCGEIIPEGRLVCPSCESKTEGTQRDRYNAYHQEYYRKHREKINARRRELAKDYVRVVRCKDCRYGESSVPGLIYCTKGRIVGSYVEEQFFCGYGERKE